MLIRYAGFKAHFKMATKLQVKNSHGKNVSKKHDQNNLKSPEENKTEEFSLEDVIALGGDKVHLIFIPIKYRYI